MIGAIANVANAVGNVTGGLGLGSLTSRLLDKVKDIAIAKLSSLLPFTGFIGTTNQQILFMSSAASVRTFKEIERETTAHYAKHQVLYGKPVTEFTGMELDRKNFEIVLYGGLGVEPLTELENLESMAASGMPQPIFIEGKLQGKFLLQNVIGKTTHWHSNRPIVMFISLKMEEYVDSIPTDAQMKMREEELNRGATGLGGPEKLPGTPTEAMKKLRAMVL